MSALSSFCLSVILGLSRERVPLGVQARGLKLSRHEVKAAARDFLTKGMLGELPADDIKAGRAFSWPEAMLPNAPDSEAEAQAIEMPEAPAIDEPEAPPIRTWNGLPLSARRLIAVEALAPVPEAARVPSVTIGERLIAHGFRGDRKSVRVLMSGLRDLGFVITYDVVAGGYWMDRETRAKWNGGAHA
jgi:hypothetical protein